MGSCVSGVGCAAKSCVVEVSRLNSCNCVGSNCAWWFERLRVVVDDGCDGVARFEGGRPMIVSPLCFCISLPSLPSEYNLVLHDESFLPGRKMGSWEV